MAKGKPFTLDDLTSKGYADDGTGNFKKIKMNNGDVVSFKPLKLFDEPEFPIQKKKKEKKKDAVYWPNFTLKEVLELSQREGFIFVPGDVPSLKNAKQLYKNKKTGKNFITSSDVCKLYVEETRMYWNMYRHRFKEMIKDKPYPLTIQLIFIRSEKRAFDYGNIAQIVWDCMSGSIYYKKTKNKELNKVINKQRLEFAWIDDDDCDHLIPNFAAGYGYDPKLPGVIIKVL